MIVASQLSVWGHDHGIPVEYVAIVTALRIQSGKKMFAISLHIY